MLRYGVAEDSTRIIDRRSLGAEFPRKTNYHVDQLLICSQLLFPTKTGGFLQVGWVEQRSRGPEKYVRACPSKELLSLAVRATLAFRARKNVLPSWSTRFCGRRRRSS